MFDTPLTLRAAGQSSARSLPHTVYDQELRSKAISGRREIRAAICRSSLFQQSIALTSDPNYQLVIVAKQSAVSLSLSLTIQVWIILDLYDAGWQHVVATTGAQ